MKNTKNIIGQKFNKLTVIKNLSDEIYKDRRRFKVLCKCDCGNEKEFFKESITNGHTKSCGCLLSKSTKERMYKHGLSKSSFYKCWYHIIQRCNKKNTKYYDRYGGRGIKICKEWLKFENFRDDMYKSYLEHKKNNKQTTIERINNDGNYCKENCRWVTRKEQSNNRQNNVFITHNGLTMNVAQWSEKLDINRNTIYGRIRRGQDKKCWLK